MISKRSNVLSESWELVSGCNSAGQGTWDESLVRICCLLPSQKLGRTLKHVDTEEWERHIQSRSCKETLHRNSTSFVRHPYPYSAPRKLVTLTLSSLTSTDDVLCRSRNSTDATQPVAMGLDLDQAASRLTIWTAHATCCG